MDPRGSWKEVVGVDKIEIRCTHVWNFQRIHKLLKMGEMQTWIKYIIRILKQHLNITNVT